MSLCVQLVSAAPQWPEKTLSTQVSIKENTKWKL